MAIFAALFRQIIKKDHILRRGGVVDVGCYGEGICL